MKYLLIVLALALTTTGAMATELVEIQLPQLQGSYCFSTCTSTRSVEFNLDRLPLAIQGVRIHISGTVNVGQYTCDFGDGIPIGPLPYSMEFVASMKDTAGGYWWMADDLSPEESGSFDMVIPFRELYGWPVTWDFLQGGHGSFSFIGMGHMLLVDCSIPVWPEATIEHASLIIEGEFEVGVEQSTWGSIKSLFR
jgi:hypothetical protein